MPPLGTLLGYHYYPDQNHYTRADLERWLPMLNSLGASWITLRGGLERAIPQDFLEGLLSAGIRPLIHIPSTAEGFDLGGLETLLHSYANWGVEHVVVFDRPNLRSSWAPEAWGHAALVERFLDHAIPVLSATRAAGLNPLLPPLEPGGDYWDTAFLEAVLQGILRRGQADLLGSLGVTAYGWTFGRPHDWGAGGPERWPDAAPYHTPPGAQDQLGFRIWEWYAHIASNLADREVRVFVLAGGDLRKREAGPPGHSSGDGTSIEIARLLLREEVHPSLAAFCFYLLACEDGDPAQDQAWFPPEGTARPQVQAISSLVERERKRPPGTGRKPLQHYILLPDGVNPTLPALWPSIEPLLASRRATLGYSVREATQARQVTLVGNEAALSCDVAEQLAAAGCTVERLAEADSVLASGEIHHD